MTAPPLYDTEEAAAQLGVPAAAIRKWKHRGRVIPSDFILGPGPLGRTPLYRLDELQPLALAYLARKARHADKAAP